MKRDFAWLIILALLLLAAMLATLWRGGEGSRHGFGAAVSPAAPAVVQAPGRQERPQGGPLRTGYPFNCQPQMPPKRL